MDELIILLIRAIIRLLSGPPKDVQQRRPTAPPAVAPQQFQPRPGNVATGRRPGVAMQQRPAAPPPAVRRTVRRPGSTMVAVAAPIVTRTTADLELAAPVLTRTTAATNIRASRGSVADKADAASAASPTDVRRWLTPTALRQQVVLAEILGTPVALRDDR